MTRKANRLVFTMWLNGCTDTALSTANAVSLANSYGLDPTDVAKEIRDAVNKRAIEARIRGVQS
jgi:hypothetical protein